MNRGSTLLVTVLVVLVVALSAPAIGHMLDGTDRQVGPTDGVESTDEEWPTELSEDAESNGENVTVNLREPNETGLMESPIPFEVVVEDPNEGINAYDITLNITDSTNGVNATFTDYDLHVSNLDIVNISDDGTQITMGVALLGDTVDPADEVTVADVAITPPETGNLTAEPVEASIYGPDNLQYDASFDGAGPMNIIEGPDPLPTFQERPKDVTGDMLVEDIDGDGEFDIFDVQGLFNNIDSSEVQENVEFFDFTGDGEVSVADVQALFNRLESTR